MWNVFNNGEPKKVMELKGHIPINKMDRDMGKNKINEDNTAQVINGGAIRTIMGNVVFYIQFV